MRWCAFLLLLVYSLQPAQPTCEKNCLSNSGYKAFIILVDGSSSMGNGTYLDRNNKPVNWPSDFTSNDLWRYVENFVNFFIEIIPRKMVVVMKQYSSDDYREKGYCASCPENLTRVLQPEWTDFNFKKSSKEVFRPWTNGDTYTFQAVARVAKIWGQRRAARFNATDKALLLLITDGQPSGGDVTDNADIAKQAIADNGLDVFLVFPSQSSNDNATVKGMAILREKLLHDVNDVFTWDKNKVAMDRNLVDIVTTTMCRSHAVHTQLKAAAHARAKL